MPERSREYQENVTEEEVKRVETDPDHVERQRNVTEQEVKKIEQEKKK